MSQHIMSGLKPICHLSLSPSPPPHTPYTPPHTANRTALEMNMGPIKCNYKCHNANSTLCVNRMNPNVLEVTT